MASLDIAAIRADADWILTAKLASGAICWFPDQTRIAPYMAHYAAIGLTKAFKVTGNTTYRDAVWGWFDWYQSHMDVNGYVTDYTVSAGVETTTGDEDSTDAYAGMFLVALREQHRVVGDLVKLATYATAVSKAVNAIQTTQQSDGMTWAKPAFQAKLTMDQTETYAGLGAAVELAGLLGNKALQASAQTSLDAMAAGMETMWDGIGSYFEQKSNVGVYVPSNLSTLNPDALLQFWAIAWGIGSGKIGRTSLLARRVEAAQPAWDQPAAIGTSYYPFAGQAYVALNNYGRAMRAWRSIRDAAITAGRAWPFTTGNAGQLIALAVDAAPNLGGSVYNSTSLAPSGSVGNITGATANVPSYERLAFQFVVEAIGATPTVTYKFQGTLDGVNWYDVAYVTDATDTPAATARTRTTVGADVQFLAFPQARRYSQFRVVTSANTNVTFHADVYPIS